MLYDPFMTGIRRSWVAETAQPILRDRWSKSNPEVGQSLVSALVLQHFFGGDVLAYQGHYWNNLPSEGEVDATESNGLPNGHTGMGSPVSIDKLLYGPDGSQREVLHRYELLRDATYRQLD